MGAAGHIAAAEEVSAAERGMSAEEWSRVSAHGEPQRAGEPRRRDARRVFQASIAGLLLVSTVATILLSSPQHTPLSTLQQQLQFMYAAPGAVPVAAPAVVMPTSPTLWRAADAVSRARQAVGTAALRRAFPNVPGITAAAAVAPYGYGVPYAMATRGAMTGGPVAAYHVSIPAGSMAARGSLAAYGVPTTASATASLPALPVGYRSAPFWGGVPQMGYAGAGFAPVTATNTAATYTASGPQPIRMLRAPTAEEISVNAAINAGASAAAGAGLQEQPGAMYVPAQMKPAFMTQPSYAFLRGNVAPRVTVQTPTQTVTMSSSLPAAQFMGAPAGAETMKIVAGPGKGKIVDVTAQGKIVGEQPQPVGGALQNGMMTVQPMMGVVAPMHAVSGFAMGMPSMPSVAVHIGASGQVAATAEEAAVTAENDASPAPAALKGGEEIDRADGVVKSEDDASETKVEKRLDEDAESAAQGKEHPVDDDTGGGVSAAAKDGEGAANHGVMLGSKGRKTPQLSLKEPSPESDKPDSLHEPEDVKRRRERLSFARRADEYSDMTSDIKDRERMRPEVLVAVPHGKRAGDFFSAQVAGRGSMLIEVPEHVRGGDYLELRQMPADNGEDLEWVKYTPGNSLTEGRRRSDDDDRAEARRTPGPSQDVIDRTAAARDSIRTGWALGDRAPRSYFH